MNCFELSSDNNKYFIEMKDPTYRQQLLEEGAIFISSRILVIREWCSAIEGQDDQLTMLPLWINLVLPWELWKAEGICYSASLFGVPLAMDQFTAKMTKTKFARVCVEVRIGFLFPESIPVDLESIIDEVKAEYKWKPEVCDICIEFGHNTKTCLKNMSDQNGRNMGEGRKRHTSLNSDQQHWRRRELLNDKAMDQNARGVRPDHTESNRETCNPVAIIGTRPGEIGTFMLGEKEVNKAASLNRFSLLSKLDTESNLDSEVAESGRGTDDHDVTVRDITTRPAQLRTYPREQGAVTVGTTKKFLNNVDDCLDIYSAVVNNITNEHQGVKESTVIARSPCQANMGSPVVGEQAMLTDKRGTNFDPRNPDTWTEATREADEKIALVMSRMKNPESVKKKPTKVDLRVKLVRGNSGALIRSSSRNIH